MSLPKDFKEFIGLMIAENVQFVMIGGYAFNLYRNPRATGDIDFLVAFNQDNDIRLRKALTRFGFGTTLPSSEQPLLEAGKVIMLSTCDELIISRNALASGFFAWDILRDWRRHARTITTPN